MPLYDSDISWDILHRIVRDWAGSHVELSEVRALEGGCINTTLSLLTKCGERAVLKITPHRVNREFEREARQLELLRDIGIAAPKVFAQRTATLDDPHSYLLMEFIEGVHLSHAKRHCCGEDYDCLQCELADVVATLHDRTAESYSRCDESKSARFDSWPAFYHSIYDPIWKNVQTLPACRGKHGNGSIEFTSGWIAARHHDQPRLTHWDLWSTNLLAKPDTDGRWHLSAVLDPNCRYAHAEAEIAYMELFHTVTPAFLKAYKRRHPLGDGYRMVRKGVSAVPAHRSCIAVWGKVREADDGGVGPVRGVMLFTHLRVLGERMGEGFRIADLFRKMERPLSLPLPEYRERRQDQFLAAIAAKECLRCPLLHRLAQLAE